MHRSKDSIWREILKNFRSPPAVLGSRSRSPKTNHKSTKSVALSPGSFCIIGCLVWVVKFNSYYSNFVLFDN